MLSLSKHSRQAFDRLRLNGIHTLFNSPLVLSWSKHSRQAFDRLRLNGIHALFKSPLVLSWSKHSRQAFDQAQAERYSRFIREPARAELVEALSPRPSHRLGLNGIHALFESPLVLSWSKHSRQAFDRLRLNGIHALFESPLVLSLSKHCHQGLPTGSGRTVFTFNSCRINSASTMGPVVGKYACPLARAGSSLFA